MALFTVILEFNGGTYMLSSEPPLLTTQQRSMPIIWSVSRELARSRTVDALLKGCWWNGLWQFKACERSGAVPHRCAVSWPSSTS